MGKRTKKISVNLTEEQYAILEWLAKNERRSLSELAALILVDNAQLLFLQKQPKGETHVAHFIPNKSWFGDDNF